jgi:ankyrin repeat protein
MKPQSGLVLLGLLAVLTGCQPSPPATALHEAVQKGDLRSVQQHIAAKSDLDIRNQHGATPLQIAAMKGNLAIVRALCEAGADVHLPGPRGRTALDLARETRQTAVADFLNSVQIPAQKTTGRGLVDGGLGVSEVLDAQ